MEAWLAGSVVACVCVAGRVCVGEGRGAHSEEIEIERGVNCAPVPCCMIRNTQSVCTCTQSVKGEQGNVGNAQSIWWLPRGSLQSVIHTTR